jgi:hypothetical protein
MAAIAASRDHPGHHFRQLLRDHSQNDNSFAMTCYFLSKAGRAE